MDGSGRAALRRGAVAGLFLALGLGAGAASGTDNASFVSYSGVPDRMLASASADVVVTMRNTGTTTWENTKVVDGNTTTDISYWLGNVGSDVWGVKNVDVSGSVRPGAEHRFRFRITAPTSPGSYVFRWRMDGRTIVIDRPVIPANADDGFGARSAEKTIVVEKEKDVPPSFGAQTIPYQDWLTGHPIEPLDLPKATGGNGTLSYSLACHLPGGVSRSGRRVSGTPRTRWGPTECTWKATDSDGNTADSDAAKLKFMIRARRAAFVVNPERLNLHESTKEDNHSETFTVKLDGKPLSTVTVSLAGWDDKAVTVDPARLTFSPAKFRDAQTVTVTAKDDLDASNEATEINLSGRGGGYDSITSSVAVNVKDDDERGVIVNPTALATTEGGEPGKFTVRLKTQPTTNVAVTMTMTSATATAPLTLSATRLTFTPTTWATPQTVKVTADKDEDTEGGKVTVHADASGADYGDKSATVEVTVTDPDEAVEPDLVVDPPSLTIAEGASKTFTVHLTAKPTANVTVSLSSRDTGAATVNLPSLRFRPDAFDQTQTVTVTGVHDRDFADEDTTIDLSAAGGGYENKTKTVNVAVDDDDTDTVPRFSREAGEQKWVRGEPVSVTLPPATGGNWALEYALSPDPPAGVRFDRSTRVLSGRPTIAQQGRTYTYVVTDSDSNEAASDRATQTFTIEVVEPEPDPDPDPDPDPNTQPVFSRQVPAQKWTKDKPVSVTLPEATGGEGALSYNLSPKPPAGVTFNQSTRLLSGTPAGTQAATTYTYTASDADEDTSAGDTATQSFTITVAEPPGPDAAPVFGESAPDLHWFKDQPTGAVVLPPAAGGNGALTYRLAPPPPDGVSFDPLTRTLAGTPTGAQGAVIYTYTAGDADANTAASDEATLSFEITVHAEDTAPAFTKQAEDLAWEKDQPTGAVVLPDAAGGNGDLTYKLAPEPPAGVTFDPLTRTLAGAPTGTQDVVTYTWTASDEDGNTAASDTASQTFSITVAEPDTAPAFEEEAPDLQWAKDESIGSVVLPAATGGNGELIYALSPKPPAGVTFDPATRTLSGAPTVKQAAETYTYTATDADGNTDASDTATQSFTIAVKGPHFVVSETQLSIVEEGEPATFTVRLGTRPSADVWVTAHQGGAESMETRPWRLTFTPDNYGEPQQVAVHGVHDPGFEDEDATVFISGQRGGYDRVKARVAVLVTDDDTDIVPTIDPIPDQEWLVGQAIEPLVLPVTIYGNRPMKYSLSPDPPDGVSYHGPLYEAHRLSGVPTTPQAATTYTFTVTDSDENDSDEDSATAEFTIAVKQPALVLSEASVALEEGGAAGTFSVKLAARPTSDVTVTLASADADAVTASPPSLTFTTATHATARTVTVTAVQDDDPDDETVDIALTASGGGYDGVSPTVAVTVDDDETDTAPSFDGQAPDREWTADRPITTVTLPEATGGNGELTYTLSPEPPVSVTFDPATRTLSGTPTATQDPTLYTYTAVDADGNTDAADAATLTFTIEVWLEGLDDAAFVSHAGVPEVMLAGEKATVTIRMRNTGPTTWRSASYRLGSQRPQDNEIWGLARVALPADVAPDETVDLTFAITAPTEVGAHKFRWRMVRGASGWFGGKTELLTIAVEDPSFLGREIPDQTWVKDETVVSLTLPEARGAGGALTYSLKPALPDGVTFTEATRVLAGTPTAVAEATEYRYVATDTGGKKAKLTFEIAVEEGVIDDAAVVRVSGLPSKMAAGGTATVTVTMTNTGTTTWSSPAGYNLGSWDRSDKDRWGVRRAAVAASVAPNETADFTFDVTAPKTPGVHPFTWRMVRDPGGWFGAHTADVSVTVEDPSFGDETVPDQSWMQGEALDALVLPAAAGTAGPLSYAISPDLPDGVRFAESTRTVSGTPEAAQAATRYGYTATDTDGGRATLSFEITVEALALDDAAFVSQTAVPEKMAAGSEAAVTVRMKNTGTTTWTKAAGYALGSQRPDDNERWGLKRVDPPADVAPDATVDFTFTITAPTEVGRPGFRWRMVRGADGWFGRKTDLRTIEVEDPSFGDAAIGDQKWAKDAAIATLLLHEADGTAGPFTYSLTPDLPDGVTFDGSRRTISGRPTAVLAETEYAYTATDANGGTATLTFMVTVSEHAVAAAAAQGAVSPPPPSAGVAFEFRNGVQAGRGGSDGAAEEAGTPGWFADSGDATISRIPAGLALRLRGSGAGGDEAPDAVITEQWIPVVGGTWRLSACMLRENASDNVFVDFDGGAGRDGDFLDAHIVATETGVWECGAVTKCIPESVGAVRVRAVREGANLGDAWFDRIELKRLASCGGQRQAK